jgi:hypothetical protein
MSLSRILNIFAQFRIVIATVYPEVYPSDMPPT